MPTGSAGPLSYAAGHSASGRRRVSARRVSMATRPGRGRAEVAAIRDCWGAAGLRSRGSSRRPAVSALPRGGRGVCQPLPDAAWVGTGPAGWAGCGLAAGTREPPQGSGPCGAPGVRRAAFTGGGCREPLGVPGPAGLRVEPGRWWPPRPCCCPAAAARPLGETGALFGPRRVRTQLCFVHQP